MSPYQQECSFFSWGNTDGHNPTGAESFLPWTFGSDISTEPYVSSPGAQISYPGSIGIENDAARACCGYPWQVPTPDDFNELLENTDFIDANGIVIEGTSKSITMNGVRGIRLRSKINGRIIFISCSGRGNGNVWRNKTSGYYWSTDLSSRANGAMLLIGSTSVGMSDNGRQYGFSIRPVTKI